MAPKVSKRPSAGTSTDKTAAAKVKQKILKVPAALFQKGRVDKSLVKKATEMTREQFVKFQEGMDAKWPLPGYMNGEKGHCHFRDETYERITRWTAETRIAYRPHAKAPGSKSHLRYEKYSSAKTVGEALRVGSYPMDWCWDYERGFIKVLGGPMREEPLDVAKEDEGQVTDVDRTIANWYVRELAKMVGVKGSELTTGSGVGESTLERGRRLLAQREACERLEAADREGRRINDEDVLAILKRWPFAKNPYRKNVMQPGKTWVFSDSMGILRDRQGDVHLTACSRRYPQVVELFGRWLKDHLPDDAKGFTWTTINVNCNYAAVTHRDNGNFGPSFIKAFGEFEGGALNYWPDDSGGNLEDLPKSKQSLDLTEGLALFNGNCAHGVQPFKGSRYSLVYFTVACHPLVNAEDRKKMALLGFPLPAPDMDPHQLLRPPKGYCLKTRVALTPAKHKLPAFRFYKPSDLPKCKSKPKSDAQVKKIAAGRYKPETQKSFYSSEARNARKEEKDDFMEV